ncbi:MAG: MFS transporter [Spirochaetota bacterium]
MCQTGTAGENIQRSDTNFGKAVLQWHMQKPWIRRAAAFLSSQAVSLFGSSLVQYALLWYVTLETKSGIAMTVYIICGFLPTFLIAPFGGVLADRYNRKYLIIVADALIAVTTLALAVLFMAGGKGLWLVMVAAALRAVGTAVQGPAVGAILPQFVPKDALTRVNGISSSIQSAIMLLSPVVSGVLITFFPMHVIFLIDIATAAVAITVLMFFLDVPAHRRASQRKSTYFADMIEGFRYIRGERNLVSFFIFLGILMFLVAPAALLTPLQVARTFGSDVWRLTAIEVVFSGGMMLGGIFIGMWGGFRNRMHMMLLSSAVMALCTIALGLPIHFGVYCVFMGITGIALAFFNTPSAVYIQERVPTDYLGRVFSISTMLFTSMMPIGMLLFGPLAEIVRIEWMLIATGLGMLVLIAVMCTDRTLVRSGMPVRTRHAGRG